MLLQNIHDFIVTLSLLARPWAKQPLGPARNLGVFLGQGPFVLTIVQGSLIRPLAGNRTNGAPQKAAISETSKDKNKSPQAFCVKLWPVASLTPNCCFLDTKR